RLTGDSNNHTRALLSLIPSVFLELNEHCIISEESFSMCELERWMRLWRNEKSDNIPLNFIESLRACDMESFPNIHQLFVIGCTLPITSAEAERTFLLLRRIKVYTRSTLTEEHFSDLGVIAMHYDVRVPTDDVVKAFLE
uniref:HAT C-terminal dimerisation domain-containing protein n=1 Tax=Amphimedon queenslandica TaxID=400682 RepID=A0A1X7TLI0_AMPQE